MANYFTADKRLPYTLFRGMEVFEYYSMFKNARKEGLENFMYGGKKFSTATAEDVKSAGYDNLKDYLNSRFKKKVQNETPTDLS